MKNQEIKTGEIKPQLFITSGTDVTPVVPAINPAFSLPSPVDTGMSAGFV